MSTSRATTTDDVWRFLYVLFVRGCMLRAARARVLSATYQLRQRTIAARCSARSACARLTLGTRGDRRSHTNNPHARSTSTPFHLLRCAHRQLRQRYNKGGSASDDSLSASQVRARHAISSNAKDFGEKGVGGSNTMLLVVLVVVLGLGAVAFFMKQQ